MENELAGQDIHDTSAYDYSPILDLPPEIILEIFRFVDFHTLFKIVILTCKHFYDILTGDEIWKTLFALKWKDNEIVNDLAYVCDWNCVCFCYEELDRYWKHRDKVNIKLQHRTLNGHYGSVDDVHILHDGRFCVSGSRDRTALLWDLSNFVEGDVNGDVPSEVLHGHEGWVWSVDSDKNTPNVVVTSSWDSTVKEWDLNANGQNTAKNTYEYHTAAVLDLHCHDNVYTTACYDRTIRTFDPRSNSVVLESKHHKKSVLCIQVTEKYILSGSEDQTIGVYDVRGGKLMTRLEVDSPVFCMNLASHQGFNYLRAGGRNGSLYVFDTSHDHFTFLNSSELWKKYKLNQLCNYRGAVVACSQNGSVSIYSPDRKFSFIEKFVLHSGDVVGADSRKDLFVTGSSDNSIIAWKFY